jgi:membrane protein YdbS with pleckstrin-like domain
MHCTNCGTYIAHGARFCAGCGAPAVDPEMTRVAGNQTATNQTAWNQTASHQRAGVQAFDAAPVPQVTNANAMRPQASGETGQTIFVARPTQLFINIGYAAAALGAILLTVLLASIPRINISPFVVLPLALALLLIPAYYHIRRNSVRYTLTDSDIQIDTGLLSRTTRNVPLRTIQDVTVSATIPQRLLGYGNVIIDNASEQGGHITLRNIRDPRGHADQLLRELRRWR